MSSQIQLPLVGAKKPIESWVSTVQAAIVNTRGEFAITDFSEDLTWDSGCKLSKKVLKAYLASTWHHPWELHGALDLHIGENESASKMKTASPLFMERHVDRGLFNIVQANAWDRQDLHLDLGTEFVHAHELTRHLKLADPELRDKLLIVIPGYTLHLFEPKLQAPAHKVEQQHRAGPHARSTRVVQCRLPGSFELRGQRISYLLAKSFVDESEEERIQLIVKDPTDSTLVLSLPVDTSADNVRQLVATHLGGIPLGDLRLLLGRGHWDEGTIAERGISSFSTVHALSRLRGD